MLISYLILFIIWHYACRLVSRADSEQEIDTREIAMDIKTNSLFAQMQAMSVEATSNRSAEIPAVNTSSSNFGDMLKDAVSKVNDIQLESGDMKKRFELGDSSVTLAETMIASQKAGVAFDATVQIRNKFVEAYKEIMSMPV